MKNRKIKLTKKDMHIIDIYSKKNLSDTIPQWVDDSERKSSEERVVSAQEGK